MSTTTPQLEQVDVRGPRFAAWVTTGVLVLTLILLDLLTACRHRRSRTTGHRLRGRSGTRPQAQPVRPDLRQARRPATLGRSANANPWRPLRFAQFVGFVFALAGTVGFLAGSTIVGTVATGFALFAALLNAAFGICLGCQIYPLVARLRNTGRATTA